MRASDDQLKTWMVEGLEGDAASHASLLRALVPILRAFYASRIGDKDTAEDLVQETLIAVHTRRISYDRDRDFAPWLFAIARYKMIDHFRRSGRTVAIDSLDQEPFEDSFDTAADARLDVETLLATLPDKQARAIRRTRIEGGSVADAARAGGISEADVKISVHRGLKALAARLRGGQR